MATECQHCQQPVNEGWTLCTPCRTDYARQLHRLRGNLYLLQRLARREYRLGDPAAGGKSPVPATPADLGLLDQIDTAESLLKDIWTTARLDMHASPKWQRLMPKLQAHMGDLCQSSMAGEHLDAIIRLNEHIARIVDRTPRNRRIIGHCPQCGTEATAGKSERIIRCPQCGTIMDAQQVKAATGQIVDRYHKTLTPAGCAQWLKDEYGYRISRKDIDNWLRRGKLPSSKPVDGSPGYWEFSIREVTAMAMGKTSRQ